MSGVDIKAPVWVESFWVTHDDHPAQLVGIEKPPRKPEQLKALAVQEAARRWGVPWGSVYEDSRITPVAKSWKCWCATCGRDFFSMHQNTYCESCMDRRRVAALTGRPLYLKPKAKRAMPW